MCKEKKRKKVTFRVSCLRDKTNSEPFKVLGSRQKKNFLESTSRDFLEIEPNLVNIVFECPFNK